MKLRSPRFKLQKMDGKLAGSVISDTFKGRGDSVRQHMIWDALEEEFGREASRKIGALLAYTNEDRDIDIPAKAG